MLEEKPYLEDYIKLQKVEDSLFKQNSRIKWLKEGDGNTSYFHKCVNGRTNRNRISKLKLTDGSFMEDYESIKNGLFYFFKNLFHVNHSLWNGEVIKNILTKRISQHEVTKMVEEITRAEIEATVFSLANDKALGLDGYGALFFKKVWNIVGNDVMDVIQSF